MLLAGPAMSALAAVLLGAVALLSLSSAPWWLTLTLTYGALQALIAFLYNIDPRPATKAERERAGVLRDGPKALHRYRLWRAGALLTIVTPQAVPAGAEAAPGNSRAISPPGQS